jgi:trigger factor
MNIAHENSNSLNAVLRVKIEASDYQEKVEKGLKDYRRKAAIKGFRPGMAPASLINKLYRKPILLDEVNKLISESISKYIHDNNIKILGEPLPSEQQADIDWDNQSEFEFAFDLGMAPEFEIKLSKRDKFPYYLLKVDAKTREDYKKNLLSRFGNYSIGDVADEKSLITATLTELNADESPRENGVIAESALISLMLVADATEKAKFMGCKAGDVLTIDAPKAFPNETDRARLLRIEKDELNSIEPLFQATITEVKEFKNAEINQDLFNKAFGEGVVNSEEEFNQKVDEAIENQFKNESDNRLRKDIREKLIEKTAIELPKEFLVRWLVTINEGKFTTEQVEKDYIHFESDLKWQLIRDFIAREQEVKIEAEDLKHFAKIYVRYQMASYGMGELPDNFIEGYADEMLKKEEQRNKIAEAVVEEKVFEWIKETIKLDEKKVDRDEFEKL